MQATLTWKKYIDYAVARNAERGHQAEVDEDIRSVQRALDTLAMSPVWAHFHQQDRVQLTTPIAAGTVSVAHLAVAVTGVATTWATAGTLVDDTYTIRFDGHDTEYMLDPTFTITDLTLQLKNPFLSPNGLPLAGVEYQIIKREYALPDQFRMLMSIDPVSTVFYPLAPATLPTLKRLSQNNSTEGFPTHYCVASRNDSPEKFIRFFPFVSSNPIPSYDITYQRFPAKLSDVSQIAVEIVDWPDEMATVLEKAIEAEIARKNGDFGRMDVANNALGEAAAIHLVGGTEDVATHRVQTLISNAGDSTKNPPVDVDVSGVVFV